MSGRAMSLRSLRGLLIGDRAFYRMVLAIVVPIMIQNAISNFVNLLDNLMVGSLGTDQLNGVAIANQLMFVFSLCVFGGISGAGIFSAQYHGAGDHEGVRACFRFKLYMGAALVAAALAVFLLGGEALIDRYLNEAENVERMDVTMGFSLDYLHIMLWGLAPFALTQIYAGTLRETGETNVPMIAGIAAVIVNLAFNYLLIFDHGGIGGLGVRGAAIATVLSRFVELGIVVFFTHTRKARYPFARGLYRTLRVPMDLVKRITVKGLPLLVNEALWSLGMATLTQCYSVKGLDVVAAVNISSTVSNLFAVTFLSMGSAAAIVVGQALGSGELKRARSLAWKLITFSLMICCGTSLLMLIVAPLIPSLYDAEDHVRSLATSLLNIYALCMPLFAFANCTYFILRSGGKTMLTFAFDSAYTWVVAVPLASLLVHATSLDILSIYLCVQLADIIKCVFGFILLRKGVWVNNMVARSAG